MTVPAADLPPTAPPRSELDTDELAATSALDETQAAAGELRLSDLLADDEPDEIPEDDLFAPRPVGSAAPSAPSAPSGRSYAAELAAIGSDEDDAAERAPRPWSGATATPVFDEGPQVYVEGEDDGFAEDGLARRPNGLVVALAWIIPILAGGALGLFFALLIIR